MFFYLSLFCFTLIQWYLFAEMTNWIILLTLSLFKIKWTHISLLFYTSAKVSSYVCLRLMLLIQTEDFWGLPDLRTPTAASLSIYNLAPRHFGTRDFWFVECDVLCPSHPYYVYIESIIMRAAKWQGVWFAESRNATRARIDVGGLWVVVGAVWVVDNQQHSSVLQSKSFERKRIWIQSVWLYGFRSWFHRPKVIWLSSHVEPYQRKWKLEEMHRFKASKFFRIRQHLIWWY